MFSGIVEELGVVRGISRSRKTLIRVEACTVLEGTGIGDSIAVNGTCLTVVKKGLSDLTFEVMPETIKTTNLGSLRICDKVNLERSLMVGGRISGHFVTGHVDCMGTIRSKGFRQANLYFDIAIEKDFFGFILPKGSIAVDGVSLTVMSVRSGIFSVYLIGHTLKNTTLGFKGPSDRVNVEFDILAKKAHQQGM